MKKKTIITITIISIGAILTYLHERAKKYINIISDGTSWDGKNE